MCFMTTFLLCGSNFKAYSNCHISKFLLACIIVTTDFKAFAVKPVSHYNTIRFVVQVTFLILTKIRS